MADFHATSSLTILLLGGTGFIGINLAEELARSGHRVIVAGRTSRNNGGDAKRPDVVLALVDTDAIVSLVREQCVDIVVHLASTMVPSSSPAAYENEQMSIALPTVALGRALAEIGTDLVFLSSGGTVYGIVDNALASESHPCRPISYYGQAKLSMEADLAFLHRVHGLNYLIVRPSNPFGPHQALRGPQGLVSVILGKMLDGNPLDVWGDGTSIRDYIYIDDLVTSMRELIERRVRNTIVNLGSGQGNSLLDVVTLVKAVTGRPLDLKFRQSRSVDVPRLVLDIGRLRRLGLDHARPLRAGIEAYVQRFSGLNATTSRG